MSCKYVLKDEHRNEEEESNSLFLGQQQNSKAIDNLLSCSRNGPCLLQYC